jgi:hypothetical protein
MPRKPKEIAVTKVTLMIDGAEQTRTLQAWCHYFNVSYVNARMRYTRGKRGMDIFKINSDKPLEPNLRYRYNHEHGIPRTVRQYFAIPERFTERFEHHMQRLNLSQEEMVEGMFEIMMKRLDKHELKYHNPQHDTEE